MAARKYKPALYELIDHDKREKSDPVQHDHEAAAEKVKSSATTTFVKITTVIIVLMVTHGIVWIAATSFAPAQQTIQKNVKKTNSVFKDQSSPALKADEPEKFKLVPPKIKKEAITSSLTKKKDVTEKPRYMPAARTKAPANVNNSNTPNPTIATSTPLDKTWGQRIIICNSKFEADLSSVQAHFTVNGIETIICKISKRKRWVLATRESFDNTTDNVDKYKEAIAKIGATYNRDKMKNAPSFPASTFTSAYQVNSADLSYFLNN